MTKGVVSRSKLRVLVVSAGFDLELNEMSQVWRRLVDDGGIDACVVTPAADVLKGSRQDTATVSLPGLVLHRLEAGFPLKPTLNLQDIAKGFQPDVVFAGPRDHFSCARALASACGARLVLHTEYFYTDWLWLRRREYAGLGFLRRWAGGLARARVSNAVDAVVVSDPREVAFFENRHKVVHLPWPHPAIQPAQRVPQNERDLDTLLFIGSIFRNKGAQRLGAYFAHALKEIPDLKVKIVGPVIDEVGRACLEQIRQAAGEERFSWQRTIPRPLAMEAVARACFVFSPGNAMGWGQIGDAWQRDTPVISYCEHYDLIDGKNCLVAPTAQSFVEVVARLRTNLALRERLAAAGREAVARHDPSWVARVLGGILHDACHVTSKLV